MIAMEMVGGDGATIDTMMISEHGVDYQTGAARGVVQAYARQEGCTEAYACAQLGGWSNGYRSIRVSHG